MPKYIQVDSGVNENNRHLHLPKIEIADLISRNINHKMVDPSLSLVYRSDISRTVQHTEFDDNPIRTEIMSKFINRFIDLFEQYGDDYDDFIIKFLKMVKSEFIESDYDENIIREMFYNLYLEGLYDDVSAKFFRDKLNMYFPQSEVRE